jgi:ABC-type sulfate/molybdate transport systems ATPase subunit
MDWHARQIGTVLQFQAQLQHLLAIRIIAFLAPRDRFQLLESRENQRNGVG